MTNNKQYATHELLTSNLADTISAAACVSEVTTSVQSNNTTSLIVLRSSLAH